MSDSSQLPLPDDLPQQPETSAPEQDPGISPADDPNPRKSWLRRYVSIPTLLGLALIVYFAFFSEMSVSKRISYQKIIDSLELCLKEQQDTLEYYHDLNMRLSTDAALMEQVVREQYNMKREHEDVYIFQ